VEKTALKEPPENGWKYGIYTKLSFRLQRERHSTGEQTHRIVQRINEALENSNIVLQHS
jgi:hypothetical protein